MNTTNKRLYLIDGHALIYRAYYALIRNPLTNTKGVPTGAVYGFANYLLRLLETYDCQYWAIALDSDKPTFRHEMYAEYKANREEMPDDLKTQIPLVNDLIDAMNIPSVRQDGFEADDLIAALTSRAVAQGFEVYIISKDKDLMQLVGPGVRMLAPEIGGTLVSMGPDEVKAKMGVGPERIIDYLALVGDASDNIPGLPGVGPKTALKILEAAGSVEKLLKDPAAVRNAKLEEKIRAHRDTLVLSRKLATLHHDVSMDAPLDALRRKPMKQEQCSALFKELEFGSLLRNPLFAAVKKLGHATRIVGSIDELTAIAAKIAAVGQVSIDTETTSTEPRSARLVGIALAIDETEAFYVPVGHAQGNNLLLKQVVKTLRPVIESPQVKKIGQNLKYDFQVFKNEGIVMKSLAFDAMVAAYLIDPGRRQYNLDKLAADWLGVETTPIESLIGKGKVQKNFSETDIGDAASYAGEDVIVPIALKRILEPLLAERKLDRLFSEIEMPLVEALADLEYTGVLIDTALLKTLSAKYYRIIAALTQEIQGLAGLAFNLNSPKQMSEVLFNTLKLPRSKKTKVGSYETNVDVLERLAPAHPIVKKILDHREAQKLLSTYIDALPAAVNPFTGRVHTSFNQTVTATGRLSSTGPNLQNIPVRTEEGRQIREAFIALKGHLLVSADYSQIELRILAHLSQDSFLLEAFHEDKDIHAQTASAMYGCFPEMVTPDMRRAAKTINFGLMYGMGPINLSRQLAISFAEANQFIDAYFKQFPKVKEYIDSSIAKARGAGYTETMLGRRRYLPDIESPNRTIREAAERVAINTPVQGTAADIIKIAMVRIHKELPAAFPDVTLLLQVHDELVFEAPEQKAMTFSEWVKEKMGRALKLDVPLKVDAGSGRNWKEAH